MKLMFIEAKSSAEISFDKIRLTGRIGVVTTIQYVEQVRKLCSGNFIFGGQVLGCNFNNAIKLKNNVDKYLYVGTGKFHPAGLLLHTSKDVYILSPVSNEVSKLDRKTLDDYNKKRKGALLKFLNSNEVGVLVTLKKGQYSQGKYLSIDNKLKVIDTLKKKFPEKRFYSFVFNTLKKEELENFTKIDCWVNTACPRIVDDYSGIVNIEDILAMKR